MQITSQKVEVSSDTSSIYRFLEDANNIVHLLPADNISDFQSDTSQCSFKVQGGIVITLIENGGNFPGKLFLKSGEKSPFPFTLTVHIESVSETHSQAFIVFDGEVNMFLKMMVEKPLTNLFNYMSEKLRVQFSDVS